MHDDPARVRRSPVLEDIDPLPSAKRHTPLVHGDRQRRLGQRGLHVRRHVVWPFRRVDEKGVTLGHEPPEERPKVTLNIPVGILLDQERGLSMGAVDGHEPGSDRGRGEHPAHLLRDLGEPWPARLYRQRIHRLTHAVPPPEFG